MLDKTKTRQLAYVVTVDDVKPIEGRDRVESAVVGGWTIMTRKGQFKPGDPAIYFEVDSKVPEVEPFMFLEPKHFKIKTQKYKTPSGYFYSQGLLMSAEDFGWRIVEGGNYAIVDDEGVYHRVDEESRFLTKKLNVTYATIEDNKRKAKSADKYKKMAQRHGKLFSHQPFRWLMKYTWGKKLLFIFFGRKRDKKTWPSWVVKTDEERIENLPYLFKEDTDWIATEKIDGSSSTFTLKRKPLKDEFYVCSRNVVFDKPNQPCFYDTNIYTEVAEKYDIYNKMKDLLYNHFSDCEWITIQGEIYGQGVQKRSYHMTEHNFMAFNFITSKEGRWNSVHMRDLLERHCGIPCVPIIKEHYTLPESLDELREFVDSDTSVIDGGMREGIVFRSQDGERSFKCVSPAYLIKYHN